MVTLFDGTIVDFDYRANEITIKARVPSHKLMTTGAETCFIQLHDGRLINREQQKIIYALFGDIRAYTGEDVDYIKSYTKSLFMTYCDVLGVHHKPFSFATCTRDEASSFIDFLLQMCIKLGIPISCTPADVADDVKTQIYAMILQKMCVCCGDVAELHHVEAVGMGRDRTTINHIGVQCLSLCRKHHTEAHTIGKDAFFKKYHLESVAIDEEIADVYNLKGGDNG